MIRDGYSAELDEVRSLVTGSREYLAGIESRERERTGIKNLRIGYNKVFGYYIEVTEQRGLAAELPDGLHPQADAGVDWRALFHAQSSRSWRGRHSVTAGAQMRIAGAGVTRSSTRNCGSSSPGEVVRAMQRGGWTPWPGWTRCASLCGDRRCRTASSAQMVDLSARDSTSADGRHPSGGAGCWTDGLFVPSDTFPLP